MDAWVDLYWLPVGAGGHVVRLNGRLESETGFAQTSKYRVVQAEARRPGHQLRLEQSHRPAVLSQRLAG